MNIWQLFRTCDNLNWYSTLTIFEFNPELDKEDIIYSGAFMDLPSEYLIKTVITFHVSVNKITIVI